MNENEVPTFDRWSFDRRSHAASEVSALDFTDLRTMQVENHAASRSRRWIPTFAASDESLRLVLLWRAWRYLHGGGVRKPLPEKFLTNYAALDELATARMKQREVRAHSLSGAHFRAVHHCGSYMALQAAIAYRSWRLGWDSPAIANELHVSPVMVRVTLERLRRTADMLGLAVNISHLSKGMRRKRNVGPAPEPKKQLTPAERAAATIEKNVGILRTLAEQNGGVLPSVRRLCAAGHESSYRAARNARLLGQFKRHPRAKQRRTKRKGPKL